MTATLDRRPAPAPAPAALVLEMVRWNLRDRWRLALGVGTGLGAVAVMVYALYPSVSVTLGSFGDAMPEGLANLFGGGQLGTLEGWLSTEMTSIMGPFGFLITGGLLGAAWSAGREENGTVGLLLSTPATRRESTIAAGLAAALLLLVVSAVSLLGWEIGDALIEEDLPLSAAVGTHVMLFGIGVFGAALALAVGAATGRRNAALWSVGGLGLASFLASGFAPTVRGLAWLEQVSPFSWAVGHDPLRNGVDASGLALLLGSALVLWGLAMVLYDRRDLRL